MMDIELLSQAGALLAAAETRDVDCGLQQAVACDWLDAADALVLQKSYALYWSVQTAARLVTGATLDRLALGEGGAQFLSRSAGFNRLEDLEQALERAYQDCAEIISRTLRKGSAHAESD
jgi:glutamate-ammonia-ligase adenylyltransferase